MNIILLISLILNLLLVILLNKTYLKISSITKEAAEREKALTTKNKILENTKNSIIKNFAEYKDNKSFLEENEELK